MVSLMHLHPVLTAFLFRLPRDDLFALVATAEVDTNWGGATAYVYKRNAVSAPSAVNDAMVRLQEVLTREIPI